MPSVARIQDAQDVKVRLPGEVYTELKTLAPGLDQTLGGVIRLALRAGLPTVREMTTPPIFENEVNG